LDFLKAKEEFKRSLASFSGVLYGDLARLPSTPYFHLSEDLRYLASAHHPALLRRNQSVTGALGGAPGGHLVICVHGLDGNAADLRLVKTYLEMALPASGLDFLMSEVNQVRRAWAPSLLCTLQLTRDWGADLFESDSHQNIFFSLYPSILAKITFWRKIGENPFLRPFSVKLYIKLAIKAHIEASLSWRKQDCP